MRVCVAALLLFLYCPVYSVRPGVGAGLDHRRGARCLGRRAARCHGRSVQSSAHREGAQRRHGRRRAVPHRRSADRPLRRHIHAAGFLDGAPRGHRAGRGIHRDDQRRAARWLARGNDHRHRRDARSSTCRARGGSRCWTTRSSAPSRRRRTYHALLTVVPGVVSTSIGRRRHFRRRRSPPSAIHGGRPNEGRLQLDGMGIGGTLNGGGTSMYNVDVGNAAEIVFTTSGGLGEAEVGGPVMSIVPAHRRQHPARLVLRQRLDQRAAGRATSRRSCATPA